MDAKDILGLPKTPLPLPQEKKSRPQKDSQRKPDGISREVHTLSYSLLCFNSWNFTSSSLLCFNCWWDFRYTPLQVVWHLSCLQSMLLNWSGAFSRRMKRLVILEFHVSLFILFFLLVNSIIHTCLNYSTMLGFRCVWTRFGDFRLW